MGGEGSIARSFMVMSFLTAALLVGVQGVEDLLLPRSRPDLSSGAQGGLWRQLRVGRVTPDAPGAAPDTGFPHAAGGAGGTANSGHSLSVNRPRPRLSRFNATFSREFVPAIAQLPALLSALPDQVVQVVVDLSDRQVYLYKGTEEVDNYPVAIGKDGWETPVGQFQVIDMQIDPHWQHPITRTDVPPGPGNPLGSRWIAFLPMEDGVIGFHGTYQTELIGQAVSHGCIRMHNADIEALYEHLAVGVPVIVRP